MKVNWDDKLPNVWENKKMFQTTNQIAMLVIARGYHVNCQQQEPGWWYSYLSEQYEFTSWDYDSQLNGTIQFMFQTTNQTSSHMLHGAGRLDDFVQASAANVGKYSSTMEHLGMQKGEVSVYHAICDAHYQANILD